MVAPRTGSGGPPSSRMKNAYLVVLPSVGGFSSAKRLKDIAMHFP